MLLLQSGKLFVEQMKTLDLIVRWKAGAALYSDSLPLPIRSRASPSIELLEQTQNTKYKIHKEKYTNTQMESWPCC